MIPPYRKEKSQRNNLTLYLKQLEKEKQKSRISSRKEVRVDINEIDLKNSRKEHMETRTVV